jgi:hypothetical protein
VVRVAASTEPLRASSVRLEFGTGVVVEWLGDTGQLVGVLAGAELDIDSTLPYGERRAPSG